MSRKALAFCLVFPLDDDGALVVGDGPDQGDDPADDRPAQEEVGEDDRHPVRPIAEKGDDRRHEIYEDCDRGAHYQPSCLSSFSPPSSNAEAGLTGSAYLCRYSSMPCLTESRVNLKRLPSGTRFPITWYLCPPILRAAIW